jgi:hypothetical protein
MARAAARGVENAENGRCHAHAERERRNGDSHRAFGSKKASDRQPEIVRELRHDGPILSRSRGVPAADRHTDTKTHPRANNRDGQTHRLHGHRGGVTHPAPPEPGLGANRAQGCDAVVLDGGQEWFGGKHGQKPSNSGRRIRGGWPMH